MYTLVKEMTAEGACVPLDREPLRIQKWGREKSALNTNELALQRACVTKLTKSGFLASKFERTATLVVTEDYVRKHPDIIERARKDVEERKLFIKNRKQPSQETKIQSLKCALLREVVKRWCNGKLTTPAAGWYGYLKKVHEVNQKKQQKDRVAFTQA